MGGLPPDLPEGAENRAGLVFSDPFLVFGSTVAAIGACFRESQITVQADLRVLYCVPKLTRYFTPLY